MADGRVVIAVTIDDKGAIKSIKGLEGGMGGVGKATQGLASKIGGLVASLGVFKLLQGAFTAIKRSIGDAVDRVDTLNRFPLMMEAMGFSAQESEASIGKLSDGIQGLPTRLDEVARTAQNIAIMTGDLDLATDTTLALNNAFLASGSSSADAERGLQQYVQMLSRGEVDMQSWRTLQETMGVALNEVAQAFGFAGASAQNDLYDALKDGTITFDEFNGKIIELSGGVNGFADRALIASKGIRTSMTNVRTAVVTGLANAIQTVDDSMQKAGFGSIADNLDRVKVAVQESFKKMNEFIEIGILTLFKFFETIRESTAFNTLIELVNLGKEAFMNFLETIKDTGILDRVKEVLLEVARAVLEINFLDLARDIADTVEKWLPLIAGIMGAIGAFKILSGIIPIVVGAFKGFMIIKSLISGVGLLNTASALLAPVIGALNLPLIAVALAIGALIAIGVLLWQNWDTVKAKAIELHERVRDTVQGMVEAVINFFVEMWHKTVDAFWNMHYAVSDVATGIRDAIVDAFVRLHEKIVETVARIKQRLIDDFNAMREGVSNAVEKIREVVARVFERLRDDATAVMEGFKLAVERVWNGIKEVTSFVWEVIKNVLFVIIGIIGLFFIEVFNGFVKIVETVWNTIKSVSATIWGVIGDTVMRYVDALVHAMVTLFNGLKDKLSNIWNAIKSVASAVFGAIRDVVVNIWNRVRDVTVQVWNRVRDAVSTAVNSVKDRVSTAFNAVKNVASSIWNFIREHILRIVGNIRDQVSNGFNAVRNTTSSVFNAVRNVASSVWNAIRDTIVRVIGNIRDQASNGFNAVRNLVTTVFNAIRNVVSTVWNAILNTIVRIIGNIRSQISNGMNSVRSTVTSILNSIRNTFSNIFNRLKGIVTTAFSGVKSAVLNGMRNAWQAVTGYFTKFRDAGRNIVKNIASGITDTIGTVTNAIGGVASKIRNFLPFSPAKEGPLKTMHKADFGWALETAIEKSKRTVDKAMHELLELPEVGAFDGELFSGGNSRTFALPNTSGALTSFSSNNGQPVPVTNNNSNRHVVNNYTVNIDKVENNTEQDIEYILEESVWVMGRDRSGD